MKKRNSTKQGISPNIDLNDKDDHIDMDYANFQVKRNQPQQFRQSMMPNFSTLSNATSIKETFDESLFDEPHKSQKAEYSYSYSYSSESDNETKQPNENEMPQEDNETAELNDVFEQLFQKFGTYEDTDSAKIKTKLKEAKEERQSIQNDIDEVSETIGPDATNIIWAQKQFFAELINFIDSASSLTTPFSFSEVKPEYLSLDYALEKIKSFQRFDPDLYKRVGFAESVQELFEFYAILETQNFSFVDNKPLIDLPWIRAGWRWTDEFGSPNTVPRVFEATCLPMLINKLKEEQINSEQEFHLCFCHCLEICDFCVHPVVAESQLSTVLKRRLESALGTGRIDFDVYNRLAQEFGFKISTIPSDFM